MSNNSITLQLRKGYELSPVILKITEEEWEIILNYVSELLSKHETISNKFNTSNIEIALETKYNNTISALNSQSALYKTEINTLSSKMDEMVIIHKKELANKLKEHRKIAEQEYEIMMKEKYDTVILSEKSKVSNKDTIINSLKEQLENVQNTLAESYNTRINQLQTKIDTYDKKYDDIKSKYQQQLDDSVIKARLSIKNQLTEEYGSQLKKLQLEVDNKDKDRINLEESIELKYRPLLDQYQLRLADYESSQQVINKLDLLDTKLTPILKHYDGRNNERGTAGENMIYNILTSENTYLDAIVDDTSGQTASGDIVFKWRQLRCLIEVKNKKILTKKEDTDKFTRDIELSINSDHKINCAIFVSLDTDIIPGRSRDIIQLDFIHGIPVIFIYTPPPCREIHYAVACLEKIIHTRVSTNEQEKELRTHFKNYYNHIITYQKYFEKAVSTKRREVNVLNKHLDSFNILCEQLAPINLSINLVQELDPEQEQEQEQDPDQDQEELSVGQSEKIEELTGTAEQRYEKIINAYINIAISDNQPTLSAICSYFGVRPSIISNAGGYKKIATDAKLAYTKVIVPEDKIKIIMKYYTQNGSFPSRQELISRKIISESYLRKLNKVVKARRIPEYIHEFCNTNYIE